MMMATWMNDRWVDEWMGRRMMDKWMGGWMDRG